MQRITPVVIVSLLLAALAPLAALGAGKGYPPEMTGARAETYKTVGDTKLNLYIYAPPGPAGDKPRPAIVFFFGGGWTSGTPAQFSPHCQHLASLGMVAISVDYRVRSRNNVKPIQCIADARSAMRWVRANAARLGIDPDRIAAGGGSAGGHLAACTAFIGEFDEPSEDAKISAVPNALVLFNPALVLAPWKDLKLEGFVEKTTEERFGAKPEMVSPVHHVKAGAPPTIIFHGRADTTVPFITTEAFVTQMKADGNRCELFGYEGQTHGFFNREPYAAKTIAETDKFLASLGWLKQATAEPSKP